MTLALVWLRRDLRLADNPALQAAIEAGHTPVPVYVHAPAEEAPWEPGAATRWWLHHSLHALAGELRALGSSLVLRQGTTLDQLNQLIDASGAVAVYWNRLYDPVLTRRDAEIKEALRARGVQAQSYAAHLLAEPWEIRNGSGEPYRVFTPFWRTLKQRLPLPAPLPAPRSLPAHGLVGCELAQFELLPRIAWDQGLAQAWTPGAIGAAEALEAFVDVALENYAHGRDRPDRPGTSRLAPHLHFGEISPRQVCQRLLQHATPGQQELVEPWLRQLGWRDFGHHLLYHFPHTSEQPLQASFAKFDWAQVDEAKLKAWQRGRSGIPIVDAGMRELWTTGWMHNRVRMIVASLLTKNLRYHWLHGARWFWDTLVDADLGNNTLGWQWVAGTGADAAPYFRV
ncbi:MAG TPA: deoxyribodipyrimidine photo-lyase, partial [Xanthomonadales bacterium]|nr:deoxyribodipyrimidine photo-lyase [Xanthomonadales bacterium]